MLNTCRSMEVKPVLRLTSLYRSSNSGLFPLGTVHRCVPDQLGFTRWWNKLLASMPL